ncbi:MAG: rod shape-determining protein RodA [Clostridia bacterium]|nr:rod shape-determining protein RodA [Clostridia bacterium]MBQ8973913.1 rod shape-determining protein RodA [Clostridia bacterium]
MVRTWIENFRIWAKAQVQTIVDNRLTRRMMRYFDWPLFIIVMLISLFGIVCVFSATSSEVVETPRSIMEMLETQSTYYPARQLRNLLVGLVMMVIFTYVPYKLFGSWSNGIYLLNLAVLMLTKLLAEVGRGGMQAYLRVGSESAFQPSEFGKVAMIICFAKVFSDRKKPISKLRDLMQMGIYMGIPTFLILIQPDFGTAMVYAFVFILMIYISGTKRSLLYRILFAAVLLAIPVWYYMRNTSSGDNFRLMRIMMWLHPENYPDDARQIINGQIAIGSGGLFGKGIVSPGSFASLGYISDDHTDFIFAIVCESFGLIGGLALVAAYILIVARLVRLALSVEDPYGAYVIFGVMAMLLAHIIENIGMVIGLLPVTGIPLPFVSYGGSNLITNFAAIGLVQNVMIRTRYRNRLRRIHTSRAIRL